jgi:hypothetical protein
MKGIDNLKNLKNTQMKNFLICFLTSAILFSGCKKDEPSLTGNSSQSDFEYSISRFPGGDTLPFSNKVTFINKSVDAFSWLWDFGDASQSVLENPEHIYSPGTSFLVRLTSIGKAGNNTSSKTIGLASPCEFGPFNLLTGCGNKKWSLSPENDAIRIINGTDTISSTAPAACQGDDVYTFSASGALGYDAKGQTFVNGSCQNTKANAAKFWMLRNDAGNPLIVLDAVGGGNPFLGRSDEVAGNRYELLSITEDGFRVKGQLSDGRTLLMKFVSASLSLNTVKLFLTGGSRKTWRLDSLSAAPITAGLEANPTQYYAGGPLAPCQKDDWYTFTSGDSLYVNCNGETLQPSQGYTCGADNSFSSVYTFGAVSGSVDGVAQIGLAPNNASQWIGILDRSNENVYRILDISSSSLTLRSGNGSGVVHTLKFVLK